MSRVTESEALALLSKPMQCIDIGAWLPVRHLPNTWSCSSGVINAEGVRTNLWVELWLRRSPKTRMVRYIFSVFRRYPWGTERMYQLDIQQYEKQLKNAHDMPHEHMGDKRISGQPEWAKWSFEEVLRRFCERTKMTFDPPASHPDDFDLKG